MKKQNENLCLCEKNFRATMTREITTKELYINPFTDFGFKKLFCEEAEIANLKPKQMLQYEESLITTEIYIV